MKYSSWKRSTVIVLHLLLYLGIGLGEWCVFKAVYDLICPCLSDSIKLSKFDRVLFFLKIHLDLMDEDRAFCFFGSTAPLNFHRVLDVMYIRLFDLVKRPERHILMQTMPSLFRKIFRQCAVLFQSIACLISWLACKCGATPFNGQVPHWHSTTRNNIIRLKGLLWKSFRQGDH